MSYLSSDEHIHGKDAKHIDHALHLINSLEGQTTLYAPALTKLVVDIREYYNDSYTNIAKISGEIVTVEALRQHVLSFHAHYPKTVENRIALLGLITMLKTELFTELERLNEEER